AGSVDRTGRGKHRVNRRHASAAAPASRQPNHRTTARRLQRQMRVSRCNKDAVGKKFYPVLGDDRLAPRNGTKLSCKDVTETSRQMPGNKDRDADPFRQGVE